MLKLQEFRKTSTVLVEATIVGSLLAIIVYSIEFLFTKLFPTKSIITYKFTILILSGFLFHILFEYFGGNKSWCLSVYK